MQTNTFYEQYHEEERLTEMDNRHLVELYRKRHLYQMLISHYKPKRILQLACGTGVHTKWLCENFPNIEIYASDLLEKHVKQVPSNYPNLKDLRVWDCVNDPIPESWPDNFGIILVEGAWYHLNQDQRKQMLKKLVGIWHNVMVMDYLSAFHEVTQHLLRYKQFNASAFDKGVRPDSCFTFDTAADIELLKDFYLPEDIYDYLVDFDLRFGYEDLNKVPKEEFFKYIKFLNEHYQLLPWTATGLGMTEHGCYVCENWGA
jgi:hypothetical protein